MRLKGFVSILVLVSSLLQFASAAPSLEAMPIAGLYVNADGSPLLPLLKNVEHSVDIEIYTMNDRTVRTLLREALRRNVKIRIIKEPHPVGKSCDIFGADPMADSDCGDQQKLVSEIRAAGGAVVPFDKRGLCPKGSSCLEHGKIVIADGLALISTGNFDSSNLCLITDGASTCDRDYTLVIDKPEIVGALENIFEADLRGVSYDVRSLIPDSLKSVLTVSPASMAPIVDFINSAKTSIELENQYLEDPQMNAALVGAAKRGVQVSVTVASACAFGKPSEKESVQFRQIYTAFDASKISSRMFTASNRINGKPGYMHAKAIVVDGERAWMGSVNGSTQSLTENREYGLVFDNPEWVQTLASTMREDHDNPHSETWEESLNCEKDGKGGGSSQGQSRSRSTQRRGSGG